VPTGNQLIDRAALEVNRADDLGSTGTNVAQARVYLNDALRTLINRYDWSWRIAATPLGIANVVNQTLYDASAGAGGAKIKDIAGIVLDTGDVATFPMEEISLIRYRREWAHVSYSAAGKPTHYAKVGRYQFLVAPRSESASHTFRVTYWPEFADVTDFTLELTDPSVLANAFIAPRAEEVVFLGLLRRMFRYTHEWESAREVGRDEELAIATMIAEEKATPNLGFVMQPARFADRPPRGKYWADVSVFRNP
jgi:hypothetical protein